MLDGQIVEQRRNGVLHFPPLDLAGEGQKKSDEGRRHERRPFTISHIQDESMEKGGIKLSTYMTYLTASCVISVIFVNGNTNINLGPSGYGALCRC